MKPLIASIITWLTILWLGNGLVWANPFSCKIAELPSTEAELALEEVIFKGYAIMDERRFAFIQIGEDQYSLMTGERIGEVTILRVSPQFLWVQKQGKAVRIPIETLYPESPDQSNPK